MTKRDNLSEDLKLQTKKITMIKILWIKWTFYLILVYKKNIITNKLEFNTTDSSKLQFNGLKNFLKFKIICIMKYIIL